MNNTATFTIPGRIESLNQSFKVGKWRFTASRKRQAAKREIGAWIFEQRVPKFAGKVHIKVVWFEKNRMRDFDNISGGVKVLLDALVIAGRIKGDSQKWLAPVQHEFAIDKERPRIEVTVEDAA